MRQIGQGITSKKKGGGEYFRFEKVNFQVFYFVQTHKKVVRSGKNEMVFILT